MCRDRVRDRVSKGGHDVLFAIIEHRYKNALSLIKQQHALFDQINFIDNSAGTFTSVLRVENGVVTQQQTELPDWASGIAKHICTLERVRLKSQS